MLPGSGSRTPRPESSAPTADGARVLPAPGDPAGGVRTEFASILFGADEPPRALPAEELAAVFHDLHLDGIVAAATEGRDQYDLVGFYGRLLPSVAAVRFRQEVLRDMEGAAVRAAIDAFAGAMRRVRALESQGAKLSHPLQRAWYRLESTFEYTAAVGALAEALTDDRVASGGLRGFRDFLRAYLGSTAFRDLAGVSRSISEALARVRYGVFVRKLRVSVEPLQGERDYSAAVAATFERFRQGATTGPRAAPRDLYPEVNHVEEQILDRVVLLFPDVFRRLVDFERRYRTFVHPAVERFDREVQFYVGYLFAIAPLRESGRAFCYPDVSELSKSERANDTFDLALALQLRRGGATVVPNDFALEGPERVLVVSGPNQGGKTTFARTFGQLHFLAALGLPVPGDGVRLALADHVFPHFEREEHIEDLRGKLMDELVRIREIFERATTRSVVVLNESFATTTVDDAERLGTRVLEEILRRDLVAVYVTFLDELSRLGPGTVSMVSTVAPDDASRRTFRVVRQRADGRAYAAAVANRYGLSAERVRERIRP